MSEVKNARTVLGPAGAHPAIIYADETVQRVFGFYQLGRARVTGLAEEGHGKGGVHSLHYGIAGDARCRAIDYDADEEHIRPEILDAVLETLRKLLGPQFQVIAEGIGKVWAHIHIEYQPKEFGA